MSFVTEIFGGAMATVLGTATTVGLEKIKADKGKEYYEKRIKEAFPVIDGFFRELAEASKTKIDDKIINSIAEAMKESAAANEVELPVTV